MGKGRTEAFLEKAALGSPMMIAIDDLQWADTARLAGKRLASAS